MTTDLVRADETSLATVLGVSPAQLMTQALSIANTLTTVLREQKMTRRFGQGEHVEVEGWQLAGSLLGFVAREKSVVEQTDGSFIAEAELYCPATGRTFTHASGYCGTDEPSWKSKPKYARRGMAVTRSINRVYANNFRWLIKLAGFKGTPAEEMTDIGMEREERPAAKAQLNYDPNDGEHQRWLERNLENGQVPKDHWEAIGQLMTGRPTSTLASVVQDYRQNPL